MDIILIIVSISLLIIVIVLAKKNSENKRTLDNLHLKNEKLSQENAVFQDDPQIRNRPHKMTQRSKR